MDINELFFIGCNKYGQAGIGDKYHNVIFETPKNFAFPVFIKQISCGAHHSALLTIDGNVYTMGSNIHGALGNSPTLNYSFTPILVDTLTNVSKIECGWFHMCAIADGALYSWGKGIDGQLGHSNTKNLSIPAKIKGLEIGVQEVSCGTNHTLSIVLDNQNNRITYAFGNGIYGQLGTGSSKNSNVPVRVKIDDVQALAAGQNHSLFLRKGSVFACGDNSNGQLGTLFHKKFITQPTHVEVGGKNNHVKIIQARKHSMALSESGEMYVWGLSNKFGQAKKVKDDKKSKVEMIEGRLGNEKIYGLSTNGVLSSWTFGKEIKIQGNEIVCKQQQILANNKAILDFSIGEGYLLVLGDIVKQMTYNSNVPSFLECVSDVTDELQPEFQNTISDNVSSRRQFIESELFNESKQSKISQGIDLMTNNQKNKVKHHSNSVDQPETSRHFANVQIMPKRQGLIQIHDYHNISQQNTQKTYLFKEKQPKIQVVTSHRNKVQTQKQNMEMVEESDTFQMIKTPSSSILCEPTNFLKQSLSKENYEVRKSTITDQFQSEPIKNMSPANMRKKKYSYSYLQQKSLEPELKKNEQTRPKSPQPRKGKKIDKLMQMLEKSNNIGQKQSEDFSKMKEENMNESQILKCNRMLRAELRQKQLKISNLQEILSRKDMQIQAQRELIRMLKDKQISVNSTFNSVEVKP